MPVREPGSSELEAAIRRNWETARAIGLPHFPPGVYRHRSIEELNEQVDRWRRESLQRSRDR
jgi:hypothetical protein